MSKFLKKNITSKIILAIICLIVLSISGYFYLNQSLSFRFVDEEETLAFGDFVLRGEKLYGDFFSNHQPLVYIFSAGVQVLTDPNSIYLLVKKHREALIIWGVIWSLFLVFRFGRPLLLFISIYEFSKIYLLGNLFLSESLVIYPLIYLIANTFYKTAANKLEIFLIGLSAGLIIFLLSPLWPLTIFLLLILLLKIKFKGFKIPNLFLNYGFKNTAMSLVGFSIILFLVLLFISPKDYIEDVFYINLKYFIPISDHEAQPLATIKAFFAPIIAFLIPTSPTPILSIIRALSLFLVVNLIVLAKNRRFKQILFVFITLGLVNLRFIEPGRDFYQGFHLLPWFACLIFFNFALMQQILKDSYPKLIKVAVVLLSLVLFIQTWQLATSNLFKNKDIQTDSYVNYSRQFDFGEAIRVMKSDKDNLFVVPDEWLLYWQAQIDHASYVPGLYPWMESVPKLKTNIDQMFQVSPPTFFYCDCSEETINQHLNRYIRLKRFNQGTKLLVLKNRYTALDSQQIEKMKYFNFNID